MRSEYHEWLVFKKLSFLSKLLEEYNKIISADLPIEKGFLDEFNQIRFWRLPNIATVPCGGTHVHSTGEVGLIELKRDRANKGVERIRISLKDYHPQPPSSASQPPRDFHRS